MSWQQLAAAAPDLAAFGEKYLKDQVAYLATIRKDGSPRLHPIRPVIGEGHLFIFMEPTSPKGHDLRRDGRYVLHCTATGAEPWDLHEFYVDGRATLVDDPAIHQIANANTSFPRDGHFILFECDVKSAFSTVFGQDGKPIRSRWPAGRS